MNEKDEIIFVELVKNIKGEINIFSVYEYAKSVGKAMAYSNVNNKLPEKIEKARQEGIDEILEELMRNANKDEMSRQFRNSLSHLGIRSRYTLKQKVVKKEVEE